MAPHPVASDATGARPSIWLRAQVALREIGGRQRAGHCNDCGAGYGSLEKLLCQLFELFDVQFAGA